MPERVQRNKRIFGLLLQAVLLLVGFRPAFSQQEHVKLDWKPFENRLGIPAMWTPLISPEVHSDQRVTFRLKAEKAGQVFLYGPVTTPLGKAGEKLPMQKDADGVWALTVGPLPADIYAYFFEMDGVTIPDPNNTFGVFSNQPVFSELVVHGDAPAYYDFKRVPHGSVTRHIYYSSVVEGPRELFVYSPPRESLESSETKLPALYLMGGSGEIAGTWFQLGRVNAIMDNLLAEGSTRPMLIVCFNNQMSHRALPRSDSEWEAHSKKVEQELLNHVIPFTESTYSVIKGPEGRALAGLSMGGRHAQYVGLRNLDTFGSIGILSAGNATALEHLSESLGDPSSKKKIRYLFVGQGRLEKADRTFKFLQALDRLDLDYEYADDGGQGHDFSTWRWLMYEHFLPGLHRTP